MQKTIISLVILLLGLLVIGFYAGLLDNGPQKKSAQESVYIN